jgi:hypothetical protein
MVLARLGEGARARDNPRAASVPCRRHSRTGSASRVKVINWPP